MKLLRSSAKARAQSSQSLQFTTRLKSGMLAWQGATKNNFHRGCGASLASRWAAKKRALCDAEETAREEGFQSEDESSRVREAGNKRTRHFAKPLDTSLDVLDIVLLRHEATEALEATIATAATNTTNEANTAGEEACSKKNVDCAALALTPYMRPSRPSSGPFIATIPSVCIISPAAAESSLDLCGDLSLTARARGAEEEATAEEEAKARQSAVATAATQAALHNPRRLLFASDDGDDKREDETEEVTSRGGDFDLDLVRTQLCACSSPLRALADVMCSPRTGARMFLFSDAWMVEEEEEEQF